MIATLLPALLLASPLAARTQAPAQEAPADLVLAGGRVVTVDAAGSEGRSIAMRGDRIVAVNGHSIDANYTRGELWQVRSRPAGTLVKLTIASGDVRDLRLADYY